HAPLVGDVGRDADHVQHSAVRVTARREFDLEDEVAQLDRLLESLSAERAAEDLERLRRVAVELERAAAHGFSGPDAQELEAAPLEVRDDPVAVEPEEDDRRVV